MMRVTELILIRHAPVAAGMGLAGRRDIDAQVPDANAMALLAHAVGQIDAIITSPARRCCQTAEALFGQQARPHDARLWEQDFGAWEGCAPTDMPDLGALNRAQLAAHRPPGGESFLQMQARMAPALADIAARGGRIAVVAHAGTVRAALGIALGQPEAGLAFDVAPLSRTYLTALPDGVWAVRGVNVPAPMVAQT
jgi:alpha-ribazole phosphatase